MAEANQDGQVGQVGEMERRAFALRQQNTAVKTCEAVGVNSNTF